MFLDPDPYEAIGDFHDVATQPQYAGLMEGLRSMLGEGPQLAYLSCMANGYWNVAVCSNPRAVMDGMFGRNNFRNEISWKRTTASTAAITLVVERLRRLNPVVVDNGRRRYHHHRFLNDEVGHPHFDKHVASVTALM